MPTWIAYNSAMMQMGIEGNNMSIHFIGSFVDKVAQTSFLVGTWKLKQSSSS